MREAIAFHLFSGHAWFTAGAVVLAVALVDLSRAFVRHPRVASAARVAGLIACAAAALSGTPAPLWLAIAAIVPLGVMLFVTIGSPGDAIRRTVAGATLLVAGAAIAAEVPYHFTASTPQRSSRPIVVIGDSLSSGGFGEGAPWPAILATSRRVTNASQPSENVSLALRDVVSLLREATADTIVVLEIGGNDMLDRKPAAEFERDLHALVREAAGRTVVMLELPVMPGMWRFGAAQRRVAQAAGVVLVPKRVLARVLTRPSNTVDGIHLTQRGHDELARAIAPWIP